MIVESPNKKSTLEGILGPDWTVVASYGHIQDLPSNGALGINKETLQMAFELSDRGRNIINGLKRDLNGYKRIVIATDPDREGEAIAQHLKDRLGLGNNYERCTFNKITKKAVLDAVNNNVRKIDDDLVAAQESRRILDRVVGWEFTDALTLYLGQLSPIGRVQSQAVNIIVSREREVEQFQETTHWSINSFIGEAAQNTWQASLNVKQSGLGQVVDGGSTCWTDKNAAETLLSKIEKFEVLSSEKKETNSSAPMPFETSTLQQAALNKLGFNSKKSDSISQNLYTLGYITYIRTDSTEISEEGFELLSQYAEEHGLPVLSAKRFGKKGAVDQEAHECIRPSDFNFLGDGLGAEEKAMYKLIWTRTMASQLKPATRMTTTTKLVADIDGSKYIFNATGSVPLDKGWRVILEDDDSEDDGERSTKQAEEDQEAKNPVPVLEVGDVVTVKESKLIQSKTHKPTPFTQITLGKTLKEKGIGRPSTYTSIYEKIGESGHKYVFEDDSKSAKTPFFRPYKRAYQMVDTVSDIFKIMDIDFTKKMEDDLDLIANGKLEHTQFVKSFFDMVDEEIEKLESKDGRAEVIPCEACGSSMIRLPEKKGDGWWWRCWNKSCGKSASDLNGKPATQADLERLHLEKIAPFLNEDGTAKHPCPTENCGKPLVRLPSKKKKNVWFWACSSPRDSGCSYTAYDDKDNAVPVHDTEAYWKEKRDKQKAEFSHEDGSPLFPCPKCKEHLLKIPGKNGFFWGCSQDKEVCGFTTWCDDAGNPVMNPEEVKAEKAAAKAAKIKRLSNEDGTPKWPCKKCGSPLDKKQSQKGGFWFGCVNFPACTQTYPEDKEGNPDYDAKKGGKKRKTTKRAPKPKVMGAFGKK